MINVKETLRVGNGITVLVCDMFSDEDIKRTLESNIGQHTKFKVEGVKNCFSKPTTGDIVMFGNEDYSRIRTVEFK